MADKNKSRFAFKTNTNPEILATRMGESLTQNFDGL